MDYFDVTSPVVRFDSLRLLLAIANALDWEIEMIDVKGAFLNSDLQEEINLMGLMTDLDGSSNQNEHSMGLNRQDGLGTNAYMMHY